MSSLTGADAVKTARCKTLCLRASTTAASEGQVYDITSNDSDRQGDKPAPPQQQIVYQQRTPSLG